MDIPITTRPQTIAPRPTRREGEVAYPAEDVGVEISCDWHGNWCAHSFNRWGSIPATTRHVSSWENTPDAALRKLAELDSIVRRIFFPEEAFRG